ncbi:MAG: TonB family protein [Burkholderiales bacterium]|nr:TonB family protein [Burkholderiales bacterium]
MPSIALALAALLLASAHPAPAAELAPAETARILAGVDANPAGLPPDTRRLLPAYSHEVATSWSVYAQRIGKPMGDWARRELPDARGATVFYPFSGPDFATVAQLYPDAGRYVLVADQSACPPPALARLTTQEAAAYLARFREGWRRFATLGFFLTRELNADASRTEHRVGVTALLMAFAALQGFEVTGVQPIRIAADGVRLEPQPDEHRSCRNWESVRLTLRREGRQAVLDYVRLDLSDAALLKQPARRAWLERVAGNPTVLKAASHLPQNGGFRIARDAILDRAPSVWQDETGIEYGLLAKHFGVALYGRFTKAHALFGADAQRSLALAYERAGTRVKPIGFRVGYLKESGWSVQVALRGGTPTAVRSGPAARAGAVKPASAPSLEQQIAALEASVKRELARAKARPRKAFVSGSTHEEPFAAYVDAVRERIAAGIDPATAGRRSAVVTLAILGDGRLQGLELDRPSGSAELDAALRTAVRRAAPFPPLPQPVRERADVLMVTLRLPQRAEPAAPRMVSSAAAGMNPCELPFTDMIDPRAAKRIAAGGPLRESDLRRFELRDAMNASPGISVEDDQRYNYRGRYLVANLDTKGPGGQCRGLEERYPLIDLKQPDVETFPELQDPETFEHFMSNVQGDRPGRGHFEKPTVKNSVVRIGGARYCIGQTLSLCEIRRGRPVEIARLGTSGLMSDSGPARRFYAPMNEIVLRSWTADRKYTAADARRDAALGGISERERSGARLSYYRPEEIDWVMPNFMQWLPVGGFENDGTVKGLHELSRGETRVNNLGAPVSHGCLRLTRYGAVLARWWTPRGAKLFIHYTDAGYRRTP